VHGIDGAGVLGVPGALGGVGAGAAGGVEGTGIPGGSQPPLTHVQPVPGCGVVHPLPGFVGTDVLLTVTVIGLDVRVLPAASRAMARSTWAPLATPVVFQLTL
jgi:hypothetical protein